MDRDKLVELLQEYLCKETLTKPLDDNSIVEEMELDRSGQEDPSNRYSSKDMLAALKEMVKNEELTKEEIPTEKSIDSWISRYSRTLKQMIAKKMIDNDVDSE
ncbi:4206_t:CDS:2 [Scutellospora calospora]|uniref:4206_t:CDS:1 n=1 Tax=Scutellospora calospora TaxID=85575 RepID=A0ACA9LB05_9GLOM|nr:4206_t:CDS:2 [Scutellospora calospora]